MNGPCSIATWNYQRVLAQQCLEASPKVWDLQPRELCIWALRGTWGALLSTACARMVSPKTVRSMIKVNLESMGSPMLVSKLAFACARKSLQEPLERRPWFLPLFLRTGPHDIEILDDTIRVTNDPPSKPRDCHIIFVHHGYISYHGRLVDFHKRKCILPRDPFFSCWSNEGSPAVIAPSASCWGCKGGTGHSHSQRLESQGPKRCWLQKIFLQWLFMGVIMGSQ